MRRKTNKQHEKKLLERALKIVLNDRVSDFEALLHKSIDVSSHHRNIQRLMIQHYKIKNESVPLIMDSMLNRINITNNSRNLPERDK